MNWRPDKPDDWKELWHQAEEKFRSYRNQPSCDDVWFEAGADAMLKALRSRLEIIYAQLCGVRIEKGKTEWYSALDASIAFLKSLLYEEVK